MTESMADVNAALDNLGTQIDAYEQREADTIAALTEQVTLLTAQIAANDPTVIGEQAQAAVDRINALVAKLSVPVVPAAPATPVVGDPAAAAAGTDESGGAAAPGTAGAAT